MDIKYKINLAIVENKRKCDASINYIFLSESDYNDLSQVDGLDIENDTLTLWNIKFLVYKDTEQISKLMKDNVVDFSKERVMSYTFEGMHLLSFAPGFDINTTEVVCAATNGRSYIFSDFLTVPAEVLEDVLEWFDKFKYPFVEFNVQVFSRSKVKIRFKGLLKDKTRIEEYGHLVMLHTVKKFKIDRPFK